MNTIIISGKFHLVIWEDKMNNRELIERIEKLDRLNGDSFNIEKIKIISLIEQLEEPPKAIIPQPVADWIEFCKTNNMSLRSAYYPFYNFPENSSNVYEWDLITCIKWVRSNWNLFVRAWKNGYDIEKEKRYLVKAKGVYLNSCLVFDKGNKKWFFSSIYETDHQIGHHTRNELEKAGFGEVFNSPLFEVEEVEE